MNILITGGSGYIGSCLSKLFNDYYKKYNLFIIDDLSTGNKEVEKKIKAKFYYGKIDNVKLLNRVFLKNKIDLVIHLAAKAIVSDSVKNPNIYIKNNYISSVKFIDYCINQNVTNFLFSSTCNLYKFTNNKITEKNKIQLNSPYAESKYKFEKYLHKLSKIKNNNFNFIIFRFFNVSGSYKNIGELHKRETHLIPNVIKSIINNKPLNIYGSKFKTKDGTSIRDYIHVKDICSAFIKATQLLIKGKKIQYQVFNLGSNKGSSILDIIKLVNLIYKIKLKINFKNPREGDPPILIASTSKAKKFFNWSPVNSSLEVIVKSNYKFYEKNN